MIRQLFDNFVKSNDATDTTTNFKLISEHVKEPYVKNLLSHDLPFKYKRVLEILQSKIDNYPSDLVPGEEYSVLITGAGPCGLRAAIEARLMNMSARIIEQRTTFSRHNVLKLWKATVDDLLSLGLQAFNPGFQSHGHLHLGTRELQLHLLKVALLLGVQVEYEKTNCGFVLIQDKWHVVALDTKLAKEYITKYFKSEEQALPEELSLRPYETDASKHEQKSLVDFFEKAISERGWTIEKEELEKRLSSMNAKYELIPFKTLLIAEGEKSKTIRNLGFDRKLTRYGPAIGLVINKVLDPSHPRGAEFVYSKGASNWRDNILGEFEKEGLVLENIEYMRGSTHFIAVTILKQTLFDFKVFKEKKDTVRECLNPENMNFDNLKSLADRITNKIGIPECSFAEKNGIQIFDFSVKGCCSTYSTVLSNDTLVCPIGDSLQNPYWHQGLGINRGFHNSLDAIWSAYLWQCGLKERAINERTIFFKVMEWLVFSEACVSPGQTWTADPTTRYSPLLFKNLHFHEIERKITPFTLPEWVRAKLKLAE